MLGVQGGEYASNLESLLRRGFDEHDARRRLHSTDPFGPRSSTQSLPGISQFNGSPSSKGASQLATPATASDPYGNMPAQPQPIPTSTGGVALASLLQAGRSVTNALKIQPKNTSGSDPLKLDNQPKNPTQVAADLHYHAGFFKESQNDFAAAAENYRTVLQKMPNDVRALAGYGRVQDQLGNTVEGEKYLRRACELAPNEPATWNDLAHSHYRRSNLGEAISCEQQAVKLQATDPQYRSSLAKFLIDAGRTDEAVQNLAAVHGEAMAHFQVGCLLDEKRSTDLARQHVQRALTLNPGLTPARQLLDRWQVAAANVPANQGPTYRTTRLPTP